MNREVLDRYGDEFENTIMVALRILYKNAKVLGNLWVLDTERNVTTQADIALILDNKVVIIEAKNWTGYIKGEYNDVHWSGSSRSRKRYTVYNMVRQNSMHIRALRNALRRKGLEPCFFHSLIVTPNECEILSSCTELCQYSSLAGRINMLPSLPEKIDKELYSNLLVEISREEKQTYDKLFGSELYGEEGNKVWKRRGSVETK